MCLLLLMCVLFRLIAMYPPDLCPRLYASGAKKKRRKKRRLDNTFAGTSKIQSFSVTNTAGEDEKSRK